MQVNLFLTCSTRQYLPSLTTPGKRLHASNSTEAEASTTVKSDHINNQIDQLPHATALPLTDKDTLGISQELLGYLAAHTREEAVSE